MHIHILGICGTFMGGIAVLARAAGHKVTGCDANVYPPMSTQLTEQGIDLIEGYGVDQIGLAPDLWVIGNVVSRGNPLMEAILDRGLPYVSGPQWIGEHVLAGKWVLAVAGTHGKTTTASMLAWILEDCGYDPGFLIGGVPLNFGISARLSGHAPERVAETKSVNTSANTSRSPAGNAAGNTAGRDAPFFVIEADEYDTAFFDKRSKFVHYRPRTALLNNLEYDHADIFPDLAAIETQFHHFVRTVPGQGRIIVNGRDAALERVLARGCWSEVETFGAIDGWHGVEVCGAPDVEMKAGTQAGLDAGLKAGLKAGIEVRHGEQAYGVLRWDLLGEHNTLNALAAIAAARHVGVPPAEAIAALGRFENVKRRMEVRGQAGGVTVYDDFAHHPTAIATTVEGLRRAVLRRADEIQQERQRQQGHQGQSGRILAVLEPRSNTMKLGVMKAALPDSLAQADLVFGYGAQQGKDALGWNLAEALAPLGAKARAFDDLAALVEAVRAAARPGDHVLVMSNGGFGGVHQKLLDALAR